ncbi:MAG: FimV/HubP family polar landmark protein [Gammaproteobacteria bacterium]
MRWIQVGLLTSAVAVPVAAYALGLGKLQQSSGLNEPYRGRIELLGASTDVVEGLKVGLASSDQFERAGIPRPYELSKLRFEVVGSGRKSFIEISSSDPIHEPFLNFLLELNWAKGRLVREYTALLDPPIYDATPRAPAARAAAAPSSAATAAPAAGAQGADGTLGRETVSTDTLWSIASNTRPDSSITVQQMMLALLRANPEAFAQDNINLLKRGYVLRIPDAAEATSLSPQAAIAEVNRQRALWEEYRQGAAARVAPQPEMAGGEGEAAAPGAPAAGAAPGQDEASLKLVAAGKAGASPAEALGQARAGRVSADDQKQLVLASEKIAAQEQEIQDLKSRLGQAEDLINKQQRLLTLKDQAAADVQQAAGAESAPAQPAAEEPAAGEPAPAAVETPEPAKPVAPPKTPEPAKPAPAAAESAEAPAKGVIATVWDGISAVPGGIVTVVAALIAIIAAPLVLASRRRREGEAPKVARGVGAFAGAAAAAPAAEDTTLVAATAEDRTESATTAVGGKGPDLASTIETSVDQTIAAPAAAPVEDALAEVNVYLAYERFEQAEQLVKGAIAREPDNLNYKLRLLEVYYSSNNKTAYEDSARELFAATGGTGPLWDSAVAMWQEMSPERALFEAGAAESAAEAQPSREVVDITAAAEDFGSETVTIKPGEPVPAAPMDLSDTTPQGEVLDITGGMPGAGVDEIFDITTAEPGSSPPGDVFDITAGSPEIQAEGALDLSRTDSDLESMAFDVTAGEPGAESVLDVTGDSAAQQDLLDITGGSGTSLAGAADDLLDVTATGGDLSMFGSEDLLNVTSPGTAAGGMTLEPESTDDVFDITTAAGDENLIEFDVSGAAPQAQPESDNLEFDISDLAINPDQGSTADAALDLGVGTDHDDTLQIDLADTEAGFSLSETTPGADTVQLPVVPDATAGSDAGEFDLELDTGTGGLDLDLTVEGKPGAGELDFDLTGDAVRSPVDTLQLDDLGSTAGDPHAQSTVVMPRPEGVEMQADEDETDTKLNLAKAYIELGDADGARSILDEVIRDGADPQRTEAQRLLDQL